MNSICLKPKTVKKIVKTEVTEKETPSETYLRIMKELYAYVKKIDVGLNCCPMENGSIVRCDDCKFSSERHDDRCMQIVLRDILEEIDSIE